ncbi:MAG TPA: WG repeat-containing protein, partial [Candidatus Obscuribacter sp.]|nr:WG repeat-containing protein [Candidatus Obscuribacter sp.]
MKRKLLISTILGAVSISSLSLTACSEPKQPSGFIDKSGGMVLNLDKLSPRPTVLGNFSEGLAVVKTEQGWGCLSKTGELVFDQPFKYLSPFAEGVAAYCTTDGASRERWGYIYKNGTTAVRPAFAAAQKFSGDLAAVKLPDEHEDPKKAGRWCYIDKGGQQVIQDTFEAAEPFHDGLAVVKVNGKMGAINTAGNLIVPAKYDVVYSASNGNIVAARGTGLSGENPDQVLDYMDTKGK